MDSARECRAYFVGDSGVICANGDEQDDNSLSLGDLGRGRGGGFLAIHMPHTSINIPQRIQWASKGGELPGSAESHKGTKLVLDEDRLKLISASANIGDELGGEMQRKDEFWDLPLICLRI